QVDRKRAAAPHVKVGLVQANIGINEKWDRSFAVENLKVHQRLSAELVARGAELIVWPESSYPYRFERNQTHDWDGAWQVQRGFHQPILFGSITRGEESSYPY